MRFRPLSEALGAEVVDVDLGGPVAGADIDEMRDGFDRYHLLLLRTGPISPERQVEMTGWFGTPVDDLAEGRLWTSFSNRTNSGSAPLRFHSDYSFTEEPAQGISLHPLELPPAGARTRFASSARAWRSLPDAVRQRIEGRSIRHAYTPSVRKGAVPIPTVEAVHPLPMPHPRTGEPILFVTQEAAREIIGFDVAESDELLERFFDVLYADDNAYVHRWSQGDLVVWDNLALQHSKEASSIADGPRSFRRVVLNRYPYAELVPGVATAQREWRDEPVAQVDRPR